MIFYPMKNGMRILLLFPIFPVMVSCTYNFYPAACEYPTSGPLRKTAELPDQINETSGLARNDGAFITFNDSGGEAALYRFSDSGSFLNKTSIPNAINADWEDITFDGSHYYVADVGNNFGSRDTLVIYKVKLEGTGTSDFTENAEIISFSYSDTASHTEKGWFSNDCEAIFFFNDSLYLFAKDWVTFSTRIYVLPSYPGHYVLSPRTAYQVNALITGADINLLLHEVVLVGYRWLMPVVIRYGFRDDPAYIECGGKARKYPRLAGTQVEAVCYDEAGNIFISSEKRLYKQALYRAY